MAVYRARQQMPPWLPRAFLLAGATFLLFKGGLWILHQLQGLLTLILIALFLAFAIEPVVNRLARHGWRRGVATGLMFVLLLVLVVGFFTLLGSLIFDQVTNIVNNFPGYVDGAVTWINSTFGTHWSRIDIARQLTSLQSVVNAHMSEVASNAWGIGTSAIWVLFQTLGVLMFTFYLSADGPRFRRTVCGFLPPERQRDVLRAWEIAVTKTGGYIYSRALLAGCSAVVHFVAFQLLGVPNAITLAVWVGLVSQFVPTVGTYLAGAVPILVGLAQSPSTAFWVFVVIVAYQQFENYILHPKITARSLDMHPAVAFGLVLAGAALLGPVGAVLALPAGASVQAFVSAYIRRYDVEEHPLTDLRTPSG
ncbi:MAG: AI-2E family transporter [Streptosporangiaceae bacterium]